MRLLLHVNERTATIAPWRWTLSPSMQAVTTSAPSACTRRRSTSRAPIPLPDLDEAVCALDALAAGDAGAASGVYGRLFNPTVRRFEEGARRARGHRGLCRLRLRHGCADRVPARGLRRAAPRRRTEAALRGHRPSARLRAARDRRHAGPDAGTVAAAIRPETGLVLLETPQNPTLGQVDIAAVVAAAGDRARARRQHLRHPDPAEPGPARRRADAAQRDEVPRGARRRHRRRGRL